MPILIGYRTWDDNDGRWRTDVRPISTKPSRFTDAMMADPNASFGTSGQWLPVYAPEAGALPPPVNTAPDAGVPELTTLDVNSGLSFSGGWQALQKQGLWDITNPNGTAWKLLGGYRPDDDRHMAEVTLRQMNALGIYPENMQQAFAGLNNPQFLQRMAQHIQGAREQQAKEAGTLGLVDLAAMTMLAMGGGAALQSMMAPAAAAGAAGGAGAGAASGAELAGAFGGMDAGAIAAASEAGSLIPAGTGALGGALGATTGAGSEAAFAQAMENIALSDASGGTLTTSGGALTPTPVVGALGAAGGAVSTQAGGGMDFDFGGLEDGSITADDLNTIIGNDITSGVYDDFGTPGVLKQIADALSGVVSNPFGFAQRLLAGDSNAMKKLAQLGVPAALIAGLIEKNDSPLVEPMRRAAEAAYASAGEFGALEGPGITPSQQMAIDQARMSSGAWRGDLDRAGALAGGSTEDNDAYRGYFDKAGALTDRATRETTAHKPYFDRAAQFADRAGALNDAGEADFARSRVLADESAGPVTEQMISALMNPYLREVLDPAISDLEAAAERRRQQLRSQVARSGNDFRTPGTVNRYNVEDDLLDESMLEEVGALSGKLRYQGWDAANARAREDLARKGQASTLVGNVGRSRADVRGDDLRRYLADAELYGSLGKSAAGIEGDDLGRYLKGADVYGALGSKAGSFRADDLNRRATGAKLYGDLAKTRGALDTMDFENLKTAGALERTPYEDRRANLADTAKLYTGVVHGTAPALNATTPGSMLTKGVGALGALKSAKDIGLY